MRAGRRCDRDHHPPGTGELDPDADRGDPALRSPPPAPPRPPGVWVDGRAGAAAIIAPTKEDSHRNLNSNGQAAMAAIATAELRERRRRAEDQQPTCSSRARQPAGPSRDRHTQLSPRALIIENR